MSLPGSVEDRAVVVFDRAPRRVGPYQEEAAGAERLVRTLGLETVERLAAVVDRSLLVFLVLLVLGGDHAVLEDSVEVGLDVVRRQQVVVVVLVLFLGLALTDASRTLGVVVVGFLLDDFVVEFVVLLDE